MSDSASNDLIQFVCPKCSKSLRTKKENAGKAGKCNGCNTKIRIPAVAPKARRPEEQQVKPQPVSSPEPKIAPVHQPAPKPTAPVADKTQTEDTGISVGGAGLVFQVCFFLSFCTAALLYGPLRQSLPKNSYVLFMDMGLAFAILPWTAVWFVLFRGEMLWRLLSLFLAVLIYSAFLLGGIFFSNGAGTISTDEALTGIKAVPAVFLICLVPLWALAPIKFMKFKWRRLSKTSFSPLFSVLIALLMVIGTIGAAYVARFPGVNSVINWPYGVFLFLKLSIIITLPAAAIVLGTRNVFLTIGLSILHMGIIFGIHYAGFLLGRTRPSYFLPLTIMMTTVVLSFYSSLFVGKYLQLSRVDEG